jgi:hypothetical protein
MWHYSIRISTQNCRPLVTILEVPQCVHGNPSNYNVLAEPDCLAHLKSDRKTGSRARAVILAGNSRARADSFASGSYVCGQSDIIIDYAAARRREEPISTAVTESTVRWLVHRRMNAQQQMRWTPRGAHSMLKVRCAVMNGSLQHDHAVAEGRARRPFRPAACPPRFETVSQQQ